MAGYRVVYANELNPVAGESYVTNHPDTAFDARDVRTVTAESILEKTGLRVGELDVLDGSPPCQPFSTAGARERGWDMEKTIGLVGGQQKNVDLFFEYTRLLEGLRPRAFVAENVAGLVRGTSKGYFLDILDRMKRIGYRVEARILDAQWLGVPQSRNRLIFVGVRSDVGRKPRFPAPLRYRYTVRDAIPLPATARVLYDAKGTNYAPCELSDRPSVPITVGGEGGGASNHFTVVWEPEADTSIAGYAMEPLAETLAQGETHKERFNLKRAHPDLPSQVICANGGKHGDAAVLHPIEKRKFSIAELRRLCGFPDDYALAGVYRRQWRQLGNAVCPPMMAAIASVVRDEILC
jgi:DNA (cytosine-5)-methyltransferase 1